jgi:hypothetical protein
MRLNKLLNTSEVVRAAVHQLRILQCTPAVQHHELVQSRTKPYLQTIRTPTPMLSGSTNESRHRRPAGPANYTHSNTDPIRFYQRVQAQTSGGGVKAGGDP